MSNAKLTPDYLFEVSWEVCNKVGGIHTVISTKAQTVTRKFADRYILIGPDLQHEGANPEFEEDPDMLKAWRQSVYSDGLRIRVGHWKIKGEPTVILVDFTSLIPRKDEILKKLWETYHVDSLSGQWDYIEPVLFGYAAGMVIASYVDNFCNATDKIAAHFHEWMTAAGGLHLRKHAPYVATLFTTHATVMGRCIAGNGLPLYNDLAKFNADELARQFNGRALPFESLASHLTEVDIIITSTGSPDPVIRARDIRGVLKARKNRPMFFIDIAVPRDIDPDVNGLDNVYLYDIDDLKEVVEENLATRRDEAQKAAEIVGEEVDIFRQWLCSLDVQPTIVDLIQHGENAAHEEVARTLKRLGHVDDATREAIEVMALALVRKLNHDPIMFLKRGTMSQEGSAPRISLMRRIFNLDQGCTCSARNNGEHE